MRFNSLKTITLLFSLFIGLGAAQALSLKSIDLLLSTKDSKVSAAETKKIFESVAVAEKKSLKIITIELQILDPNFATEVVLDEDFFKLSFLLDNGWDLTQPNDAQENLLVVALRQQHMAVLNQVLKSGAWKILLEQKNSEILKQAGLEGYAWYEQILREWEKPELRNKKRPESYEYRVDGKSRAQKRLDQLREMAPAAAAPAGGAGPEEPKFTTVPVPYATNRAMDDRFRARLNTIEGAESLYSFTNAGAISYGVANVTIPKTHKKGRLEDRGILQFKHNPAEHVILQNISLKNSEEFFAELGEMFKKREEAFPGSEQAKELFVYIHGFNVDFSYAMRKTAQLMYDMDYPGLSVAFSWPAKTVSIPLPGDFRDDVTRAENSLAILELFLSQMIEKYPNRKIHIIAHSLGTRVLSQVMLNIAKSMDEKKIGEAAKKIFGEVILAAPAIDAETFVTSWAAQITPLCDRVNIYASDDDYALKVEHLAEGPNFSFPLGLWDNEKEQRGLTASEKIIHYDLSNLSSGTFSLDHSVYSEVPLAIDHMRVILASGHMPVNIDELGYVKKTNAFSSFANRAIDKAIDFWRFLEI